MPSLYPAPTEQTVEAVLGGLAPAPTHVVRVPTAEPDREPTGMMAEYVNADDSLAAIVFADHNAVNFMGGAIAEVEAPTIQEMNSASKLNDAAMESFRAAADSLGSNLNSDYTPVVRLANVHTLPGELSDDIKELWRKPRGKRGFRLTVDDYGSGMLILYLN